MFVCSVSLQQSKDRAFSESKGLSVTALEQHSFPNSVGHSQVASFGCGIQLNSEGCEKAEKKKGRWERRTHQADN